MRIAPLLLTLLATASFTRAEYVRVEQDFETMDCASCATFVENKLTRNPGVEKVTLDARKGTLSVVLKPGNTVKFAQIRDFVQQSGYKPKEARVIIRGTPRTKVGYVDFEMPELRETIRVRDNDTVFRETINKKVEAAGKMEKVESKGVMIDIFVVTSVRVL
ncbi:MAG: heavy-metal-associated domain-containing protein [Acidobacteria bacterium]|nr:heavy-metal-associated domain-containing protein [Acidobacteriota bacterium]